MSDKPAEQGRGTLQAIAQEIVANLGSCDASSDLGFNVIWATLDRHFGTGPKQAEQAYHVRGAGREALQKIFDNDDGCGCECNSPECCNVVGEFCPHCIAQTALREPGADTGTTPVADLVEQLCDCDGRRLNGRARELANEIRERIAAAERGTTPPPDEGLERLAEARWWHARIGLNHGMKWCCERIEELERAAAERGTTPPPKPCGCPKHQCFGKATRGSGLFCEAVSDEEKLRTLAEGGTTPPEGLYPRPCGLCPGNIESEADLEWHGLGNCVEICEHCGGSGHESAATQRAPVEQVQPAVANIDLPRNEFEAAWAHYASTAPGTATEKNVFMAGWNAAAPDHAREGALR